MYTNNRWKDQYGIRAPFSNKSRVYHTIIIWLMMHNTMNARMKMWQGCTDCMTWNVNKRKQTAGGWERAGGHRLATVRGLRLWLCLDWLITELICIFFNFKQTTNFSTIHLQNVIHQSGCGRTSVKNLLEFWDRLYESLYVKKNPVNPKTQAEARTFDIFGGRFPCYCSLKWWSF